jgi:hypothetical protein
MWILRDIWITVSSVEPIPIPMQEIQGQSPPATRVTVVTDMPIPPGKPEVRAMIVMTQTRSRDSHTDEGRG